MKRNKKWIKIILTLIVVIIMIALVLIICLTKPNKDVIITVLVDNGITINGSDSNIIDPQTNHAPDHVSVGFEKEEICEFKILESGYDFINRKYFCIFEFNAYGQDQYVLVARGLMFLHYDNGWKLSEKIGVIYASLDLDQFEQS